MDVTPLASMGGVPDPVELARRARVSVYSGGVFHNLEQQPRVVPPAADFRTTLREYRANSGRRKPAGEVPLIPPREPAADGLHITWYGHASSLVEVDGARVLLDPVWGRFASPVPVGPRRLHPAPHRLADLGRIDVIVVSHDHYDHLDMPTIQWLRDNSDAPFAVPLGVGAHLRRWRVPPERIVELDWTETLDVAGLRLTATPAQHFSGRGFKRNPTLWASWVIAGRDRKVFYSGDSGYFDGYDAIGAEHGPFDAVLMQVGAYNVSWADIHMTPEEGVRAHQDLRGGLLLPVHWGTFTLAPHPWSEPVERLLAAAEESGATVATPAPGERIDIARPVAARHWWQDLVVAA